MWQYKSLVVFVCFAHSVLAQWTCSLDSDCSDLSGSVCREGQCGCPFGQQPTLSGTVCADLAPYYMSPCLDDHQCSRLFTSYQCRRSNATEEGACFCQPGSHYFHGRCWRSIDFGQPCIRDNECMGTIRDPFSMQCRDTCVCADGYYERQRGECRRIARAVGDRCVLNEDCQFTDGVCDLAQLQCILNTDSRISTDPIKTSMDMTAHSAILESSAILSRSHGVACSNADVCEEGYVCSNYGMCLCPVGYYAGNDGRCYAELGSPSTSEQCIGLLADVINGICTCPPNFFYNENMRDCVRATRRLNESCVTDEHCHTFGGAARCGPPRAELWGIRECECDLEVSVWDGNRQMCRLFAGIGGFCNTDNECLAGDLEIQCVENVCTCPDGLIESGGLCLTTGLAVGDSCQVSAECTATPNTVCFNSRCTCGEGYQQIDGNCNPIIGGVCELDSDCVIENTMCTNGSTTSTCQCRGGYIAYDQQCWTESIGIGATCNVTGQCVSSLGEHANCTQGLCQCQSGYHHRDNRCWPRTGLFEPCFSTSQCYLSTEPERAVCRNSICQCSFDFPYSESLQTCLSSSASILSSSSVLLIILFYLNSLNYI